MRRAVASGRRRPLASVSLAEPPCASADSVGRGGAVLNGALRRARVSIAFSVTGPAQSTVEPASDEVDGAIGRLSVVIEAMAGGTGRRLEVCASDDCRWAFYDRGRARSGSWCLMGACGNRAKQRAWRVRQAELETT